MDRYLNVPIKDKFRSEEWVKTLKVGKFIWPIGSDRPLKIRAIGQYGHPTALLLENMSKPMLYPVPENFYSQGWVWVYRNIKRVFALLFSMFVWALILFLSCSY